MTRRISYVALNYRKQCILVRYGVQKHLLDTSECFSKRFILQYLYLLRSSKVMFSGVKYLFLIILKTFYFAIVVS